MNLNNVKLVPMVDGDRATLLGAADLLDNLADLTDKPREVTRVAKTLRYLGESFGYASTVPNFIRKVEERTSNEG